MADEALREDFAPEPGNERDPEPGNERDPNPTDGNRAPRRRRRRGRRRSKPKAPAEQAATAAAPSDAEASASGNGTRGPVDPSAKALAESFQQAVLRHTTAPVLARGRGYAKRNRVNQVRVTPGRVRARVMGSSQARYRVEITSPVKPAPAVVSKLRWTCDCPYAADHRHGTCKHVVATAIVAAKRLERTESMRRRWLGQPSPNAAEADAAEFDALAERMLAAFTAGTAPVETVLERAFTIAPPPFDVPAR